MVGDIQAFDFINTRTSPTVTNTLSIYLKLSPHGIMTLCCIIYFKFSNSMADRDIQNTNNMILSITLFIYIINILFIN